MGKKWIYVSILLALLIGAFLSPFASPNPDGFEKVAEDKGFINLATTLFNAPIADYLAPGIKNEGLATGIAGSIGVLLTLGISIGIGKIIAKKN